jgi:hypothetical protein
MARRIPRCGRIGPDPDRIDPASMPRCRTPVAAGGEGGILTHPQLLDSRRCLSWYEFWYLRKYPLTRDQDFACTSASRQLSTISEARPIVSQQVPD